MRGSEQAVCFTTRLFESGTGIGDQLFQLQLLYNLGRSCGWTYVHNPTPRAWVNRDSSPRSRRPTSFDYDGFLGLSRGERVLTPEEQSTLVPFDAKHVLDALCKVKRSRGRACLNLPTGLKGLPALCMNAWFYANYEEQPAKKAIPPTYRLDLEQKYQEARREDPIELPFTKGKIPIVVFLRLMDLIWYEEAGHFVMPMFSADLFQSFVLDPARCIPLLNALTDELGTSRCEVFVYSDGLPREGWLIQALLMRGYDQAAAKASARKALAFQRRRLALFEECKAPVTLRMKGSVELTREVVHAFSLAPIALAARVSGMRRWTWSSAFPDLGLRDLRSLLPVFAVSAQTPESIAQAVRSHQARGGELRW